MDGLIYATVSRNLSLGEGSFWFLYLSETYLTDYHEQLPLFFAIQSFFFKVLGDSMYTERICSLVMACLTALFISLTWKEFFHKNDRLKQLFWLPVLMWVSTPVVFWAFAHNMQETMMSVFAVASVYFILMAIRKQSYVNLLFGALSIFLCSFCKGPQGLFPLITIGAYWLSLKQISIKRTIIYSGILLSVPLIIYGTFLLNDHSYLSFKGYFEARLVKTFTIEERLTTSNRFHLISTLAQELIPIIGLSVLVRLLYHFRLGKNRTKPSTKSAMFFLLIGLSGSLPLMVTLEQRNFYLATSIPFFALAAATLTSDYCSRLVKSINTKSMAFRFFNGISIIGVFASITFAILMKDGIKKGKDILPDIHSIGNYIGTYSTISMPADQKEFAPRLYLMRYYHISVDQGGNMHTYLFQYKNSQNPIPEGFTEIDLSLKKYKLYKKHL